MIKNCNLKKISKNEYGIFGDVYYSDDIIKEIEKDGIIYKNIQKIDAVLNLENEFLNKKNSFTDLIINEFIDFNIPEIKIYYNRIFVNNFINNICKYNYSSNEIVNLYCNLIDLNIIKNKNIEIYTEKSNLYNYNEQFKNDILNNKRIVFDVFNYGYNNKIVISIKLKYFYSLNYFNFSIDNKRKIKRYNELFPELFPLKMLEKQLTEIELNNVLIKLLEKTTYYKQLKNK